MNVNFNGFREGIVTFIADSALTDAGVPVKMSADGTVTKCSGNDNFCGVCVGLRNGYAAVQLTGYARMKAAAKIDVGYRKLASDSNAKVAVNSGGRELLVVDSTTTEVGVIL